MKKSTHNYIAFTDRQWRRKACADMLLTIFFLCSSAASQIFCSCDYIRNICKFDNHRFYLGGIMQLDSCNLNCVYVVTNSKVISSPKFFNLVRILILHRVVFYQNLIHIVITAIFTDRYYNWNFNNVHSQSIIYFTSGRKNFQKLNFDSIHE